MILIFNGPPGSGKDEACLELIKLGFTHMSFKHQLFKETIKYYGVSKEWFFNGYTRQGKDIKEPSLDNKSRREALIHISENVVKPIHGKDFFGIQLSNYIEPNLNVCISDGGFSEEIQPIINKFGANNVTIVQLTREGCDFSSDSRRYINGILQEQFIIGKQTEIETSYMLATTFPIRMYRIHNNGSKEQFRKVLNDIYIKERNAHENGTNRS